MQHSFLKDIRNFSDYTNTLLLLHISTDAHHLDLVQYLREDFEVVDERQLLCGRGVERSPDLQVDWSVADEERREVEQFSIALELVRQHDR